LHGRNEKYEQNLIGELVENRFLGDPDVDGTTITKYTFKK
jgi:hypothetical protein